MTPLDELANLLPPVPVQQQMPQPEVHRAGLLAAISTESGRPRPWWLAPLRLGRRWPVAKGWLVPVSAAVAVIAIAAAALTLSLTVFGRPANHQPPQASRTAPPGPAPAGQLPRTKHWQLPSSGLRGVVLRANKGSIAITGVSSSSPVAITARPTYQGAAPVLSSNLAGGILTVSATCPERSGSQPCTVALTVSLPSRINVTASTDIGSISVGNMTGGAGVSDNLGAIQLRHLSGQVTAIDNLGAISGRDLDSRNVVLSSQLGQIAVSFAVVPDLVEATDQNGSVTITVPASATYRVAAHTQLGAVTISVSQSSRSVHVISASSQLGSVTVEG